MKLLTGDVGVVTTQNQELENSKHCKVYWASMALGGNQIISGLRLLKCLLTASPPQRILAVGYVPRSSSDTFHHFNSSKQQVSDVKLREGRSVDPTVCAHIDWQHFGIDTP